jgi:hypothetical protein
LKSAENTNAMDPQRSMWHDAFRWALQRSGRIKRPHHQSFVSSMTLLVIREMVSLLTEVP